MAHSGGMLKTTQAEIGKHGKIQNTARIMWSRFTSRDFNTLAGLQKSATEP